MDEILKINLEGFCAKDYPIIDVEIDCETLWSGRVAGPITITHTISSIGQHCLSIRHRDKNNDTIVDFAGKITQDRHCKLHSIEIGPQTFSINEFSRFGIGYLCDDGEYLITNYLGKTGIFDWKFDLPLWKFWGDLQNL